MIEPTKKSEGVEQLISGLMGKDRGETIRSGECMTCPADAREFRDNLSRREYAISGMCQTCQDSVFES